MAGTVHSIGYPFQPASVDGEPPEHLCIVAGVALLEFVDGVAEHMAAHHAVSALHREDETEGIDLGWLVGAGETQR